MSSQESTLTYHSPSLVPAFFPVPQASQSPLCFLSILSPLSIPCNFSLTSLISGCNGNGRQHRPPLWCQLPGQFCHLTKPLSSMEHLRTTLPPVTGWALAAISVALSGCHYKQDLPCPANLYSFQGTLMTSSLLLTAHLFSLIPADACPPPPLSPCAHCIHTLHIPNQCSLPTLSTHQPSHPHRNPSP